MKIVNADINEFIDFDISMNYQLVVENSSEFFRLTRQLYDQCEGEEGDFVLSDDLKILNFSKMAIFLYDFFTLSLNNKKMLAEVNSNMIKTIRQCDLEYEISELNTKFYEINTKLIDLSMLPIDSFTEITYENFVKFSDYKFNDNMPLPDKLSTYIKLFSQLKDIKIVIFVNLPAYISSEDLKYLLRDTNLCEIYTLFVNSQRYDMPDTKTIIIDEDLCVI